MERVGSADMCRRVRQNGRNQTSLVLRRDRSVAPLPKGKIDNSFVENHVAHPGEDQPFREESRAEMDGGHTRPVEDAFGDPVIACRVALGILPRRDLRHVDNGFETRSLGRVREVSRRLDDPGTNRITEVGGAGPGRRSDSVAVLQEITNHDLRARAAQRFGTLVLLVNQCADGMPLLHQMLHRMAAGPAGCSGHQEFLCAHCSSPEWAAWVRTRSRLASSSRATAVTRSSPNWPN